MHSYMSLVVLSLTAINVSPALSAPTLYGYENIAVHDSRGVNTQYETNYEVYKSHKHKDTSPAPAPASAPATPAPAPVPAPVPAPPKYPLSNPQIAMVGVGGVAVGVTAAEIFNQGNSGLSSQNQGNSGLSSQNQGNSGLSSQNQGNSGLSSQNQAKRTSEAFEGRSNAELRERALGDHDLDK
jgi:hypothetical protein